MADEEPNLIDQDAEALYRAITKLTKAVQFRDRDAICCRGVSVTQCYALEALVWHGPQSVAALADFLLLNSSTVSRVVDSLTKKGLVRREVNPDDRRAVILSATEQGEIICRQITEDMKARERQLIDDLSPAQRADLIRLIQGLADDYEERARALPSGCDCGQ